MTSLTHGDSKYDNDKLYKRLATCTLDGYNLYLT